MGSFYEPGEYEREVARKVKVLKGASDVRQKIRDFVDENIDENALRDDVIEMQSKPVVGAIGKLGEKIDNINELGVDFDTAEVAKSVQNNINAIAEELELSLDPNHTVDFEDIKNYIKGSVKELKKLTNAIPKMSPTQLFALNDEPVAIDERLRGVLAYFETLEMPEVMKGINDLIILNNQFDLTLDKYIPAEAPKPVIQQVPHYILQQNQGKNNDDDDNDNQSTVFESAMSKAPEDIEDDATIDTDILELQRLGLQIDRDTPQQELTAVLTTAQKDLGNVKKNITKVKSTATSSNDTTLTLLEDEQEQLEKVVDVVKKLVKKPKKSKAQNTPKPPKAPSPPPPPTNTPVGTPVRIKPGTRSDASKKALAGDTLKSAPSSKLTDEIATKVRSKKKTDEQKQQEKDADARAEESQRQKRDKLKQRLVLNTITLS